MERRRQSLRAVTARLVLPIGLLLCLVPQPAWSQVYTGPLYNGPADGSEGWAYERAVTGENGSERVFNTREPRIEVYLPEPEVANGAAVIMLPGGGLRNLGLGRETRDETAAFLGQGVAVILLEYRTLQMTPEQVARASAPPPPGSAPPAFERKPVLKGNANPSSNDKALNEVIRLAAVDAQSALRLAHAKAAEWHLDPERIGFIGTSAGGGVAFAALLADGAADLTPAFIVSIFGPALQDVTVPKPAPPLYLVTEADHGPVTNGLVSLFMLWKDAGERAELHVYEVPNFSMTVDLWGPRLFDWMREQSLLRKGR